MATTKDRFINIRVKEGAHEELRTMAFKERVSVSALTRTLLSEAMNARRAKK